MLLCVCGSTAHCWLWILEFSHSGSGAATAVSQEEKKATQKAKAPPPDDDSPAGYSISSQHVAARLKQVGPAGAASLITCCICSNLAVVDPPLLNACVCADLRRSAGETPYPAGGGEGQGGGAADPSQKRRVHLHRRGGLKLKLPSCMSQAQVVYRPVPHTKRRSPLIPSACCLHLSRC